MNPDPRLFAHVAQLRAARFLSRLAWAAAVVALVWRGPAAAMAVALVALLFRAAAPPPDPALDRLTGRGRD